MFCAAKGMRRIVALAVVILAFCAAPFGEIRGQLSDADRALLTECTGAKDAAARAVLYEKYRERLTAKLLAGWVRYTYGLVGQEQGDRGLAETLVIEEIATRDGFTIIVANTLYIRGNLYYYNKSDNDRARECFEKALIAYREAGEPGGQGNALKSLGDIALRTSDNEKARGYYEQALPLSVEAGDLLGQANAIRSLGDVALYTSENTKARECFERALGLYRQLGNVLGEANCNLNLGDLAITGADYGRARACFADAQPLFRKAGSVRGEAHCCNSLGIIALLTWDHRQAEELFGQALPLYRRVGDFRGQADCLRSLGDIALYSSDEKKAGELFAQARSLYRQVGNVLGEANCVKNLGDLLFWLTDNKGAEERYGEAIALYRMAGDILGETNCVMNLGEVALRLGDLPKAAGLFGGALQTFLRTGNTLGEANCRRRLGDVAFRSSENAKAIGLYGEASALYRKAEDPGSLFWCDSMLSQARLRSGDLPGARDALSSALAAALQTRTMAGTESVRLTYQERVGDKLKEVVMELAPHDATFALAVFELFRGRSFLEGMSSHAALAAAGVAAEDLAGWQRCFDQRALAGARMKALVEKRANEADLAAARDASSRAEKELESFEEDIARRYQKYRDLRGAGAGLQQSLAALAPDETALVCIASLRTAGVWLVTREGVTWRAIGTNNAELETRVNAYRDYLIETGEAEGMKSTEQEIAAHTGPLSTALLGSSLRGVRPGSKLIIVPDGILGLLPWESLDAGGAPLGAAYTVAYAPSLGVLALLRGRDYSGIKRLPLIAFGGAFYDADRHRSAEKAAVPDPAARGMQLAAIATRGFREKGWEDLPGAEEEAKRVAALYYADAQERDAALFMKGWASEPAVKALDRGLGAGKNIGGAPVRLEDARVIHFAVHGEAVPDFPETSRIILSQPEAIPANIRQGMMKEFPEFPSEDGSLLAVEVVGLHLRADLVVLSACETGMGKITATEGVVGLTRSWMTAGANGVVVSLWRVSDMGTRVFMTHFHRLVASGADPRAAIGKARELVRTGAWRTGEFAPEKTYDEDGQIRKYKDLDLSSPWYWAAFQYWGR